MNVLPRLASYALATNLLLVRCAAGQFGLEAPSAPPGITVFGAGEVQARPNAVEVGVRVIGRGELADDATAKYKQARKNTFDALLALKLAGMDIKEQGIIVTASDAASRSDRGSGRSENAPHAQLEVSNNLRVRVGGLAELSDEEVLRKVATLVEAVQDSGAQLIGRTVNSNDYDPFFDTDSSQSQAVRFLLIDLEKLREQVYERAVADARERATRLAKLTGVKLGAPLAVQEVEVAGDAPHGSENKGELASQARADAKLRVRLLIRYSIEPLERETASAKHGTKQDEKATKTKVAAE